MAHHIERSHALQRRVVIMTVVFEHKPFIDAKERLDVSEVTPDVHRVVAHVGYSEETDVPALLEAASSRMGNLDLTGATYYISRVRFLGGSGGRMGALSEKLFSVISRNAASATNYFHIPHHQVVELGIQVDL